DFASWCHELARGRSYVSDGYAHALKFTVNQVTPGTDDIRFPSASEVKVAAQVAFAEETPLASAHGGGAPPEGKRAVGDTVNLHAPRTEAVLTGGERLVEVVVNGVPVASQKILADGKVHDLEFNIPIAKSSWIALRHFPQFHTNPVNVIVG